MILIAAVLWASIKDRLWRRSTKIGPDSAFSQAHSTRPKQYLANSDKVLSSCSLSLDLHHLSSLIEGQLESITYLDLAPMKSCIGQAIEKNCVFQNPVR